MNIYQKMFEIMCLLKELRKHCKSMIVINQILEIQKKYFYNLAYNYPDEKKEIAWNLIMETGSHHESAKFLNII